VKALIIFILGLYKRFLSPFLPPACRFIPTCSEYAIEALEKKSLLSALWLTTVRLAKCHPFHPGGYDPVR
jgi:putative membrane protein insertion efficiency factor